MSLKIKEVEKPEDKEKLKKLTKDERMKKFSKRERKVGQGVHVICGITCAFSFSDFFKSVHPYVSVETIIIIGWLLWMPTIRMKLSMM